MPSQALDSPPPSPVNPGNSPSMGGLVGSPPSGAPSAPPPGPGGPDAGSSVKMIVAKAADADRFLTVLASVLPQGAREFAQCKQLLQQGLAKALQGQASAGSSPTDIGSQFPGSMSPGA